MSTPHVSTAPNTKPALGLVEFIILMAFMTSLVALSIDAMLPALSLIGEDLHSSGPQQDHLIVSLFFLGMALGQLVYGPVSDAKGRRFAIISGLVIFAIGTVICMLAKDMTVLLFGRVVQAFGVSGPRIASLALIRDQYAGDAMARVMSFIMMVFILVPMLAPVFGQAILWFASWQHIFTSFLIFGAGLGVWFYLRQPETLPASQRVPFSWQQLWVSSRFILTHRQVMGYTLAMGCIFGAFLAYLSGSQTLFQDIYAVGEWFPAFFAVLAFSIGFASFVNGKLVMRLGMLRLSLAALKGVIVGSVVLCALAVNYQGLPPLALLVGVLFVTFFCVGILFGNLNSMAMHPLGEMAGLGAAIIGSLSSLLSVPVAIVIGSFVQHTMTPIAVGFLLFSVLAYLAVKWADANQHNNIC
ncbi:multidrug effflux MFS transporter [Aestuariibacter halophilus]|uniref:Bcr/CflA family efflux transporter n=1 Tax=Fluctibacter halophilus TaxID=226011 RepID=A0ABS8G9X2_9ALTE|nr:multidrug effflux MFS transporter [Aestuariibacter halophilus]MCC2616991.1 multidrug effflux MFS transporter [Aestuariibacter halophilus]